MQRPLKLRKIGEKYKIGSRIEKVTAYKFCEIMFSSDDNVFCVMIRLGIMDQQKMLVDPFQTNVKIPYHD